MFDCYPSVSNHSSLVTLATALNLCCQRHLFQLSQHCQTTIVRLPFEEKMLHEGLCFLQESSLQSKATDDEILPIQIFELYTDYLQSDAAHLRDDSISSLRRLMQREEKARLSSSLRFDTSSETNDVFL